MTSGLTDQASINQKDKSKQISVWDIVPVIYVVHNLFPVTKFVNLKYKK